MLAHGDPTSHYLETDALLTSYSAPPDLKVELRLRGVLNAAASRGYPVKVVLIASEEDTGGDPYPVEDTQDYTATVSDELEAIGPVRAPVLIVTPDRFGIGGSQPRDRALAPVTPALAAELTRGLPRAEQADGNALARTAMVAVRRLAADAGHPLPAKIPPAEQRLDSILGAGAADDAGTFEQPWVVAAVIAGTALLLLALLAVVHRRAARWSA